MLLNDKIMQEIPALPAAFSPLESWGESESSPAFVSLTESYSAPGGTNQRRISAESEQRDHSKQRAMLKCIETLKLMTMFVSWNSRLKQRVVADLCLRPADINRSLIVQWTSSTLRPFIQHTTIHNYFKRPFFAGFCGTQYTFLLRKLWGFLSLNKSKPKKAREWLRRKIYNDFFRQRWYRMNGNDM